MRTRLHLSVDCKIATKLKLLKQRGRIDNISEYIEFLVRKNLN